MLSPNFCRWARRARNVELAPAAKTSESRRTITFRQPLSIVDATLRTLPRLIGVNHVSILASICRLQLVTRGPRILRPEHLGATVGTFLRPNQRVFHGSSLSASPFYAAPTRRSTPAMHSAIHRAHEPPCLARRAHHRFRCRWCCGRPRLQIPTSRASLRMTINEEAS